MAPEKWPVNGPCTNSQPRLRASWDARAIRAWQKIGYLAESPWEKMHQRWGNAMGLKANEYEMSM